MIDNRNSGRYPVEDLFWNENLVKVIHRGLAVVMITCASIPIVMLLRMIFPEWQGFYVTPVVFLVAVEALYTHHQMRKVNIIEPRWWFSRIAELVVLLVLLRLLLFRLNGFTVSWDQIVSLQAGFFNTFLDRDYLLLVSTVLMVWLGSAEIDNLFNQIEVDEPLLAAEYDAGFSEERSAVRRLLANLIIVVGGFLISLVALLNFNRSQANLADRGALFALLIYFMCGLILLSLTHFSILRTRWVINHVQIDRKVTRYWLIGSLVLIVGLGGLVVLLPTGYSGQLLAGMQVFLGILIAFFQIVLYFLSLPFILLFSLIMSLFNQPAKELPKPPPFKLSPNPELTSSQPAAWFELIKTIFFWLVLIGLIGYAFTYYVREHPEYFRWIRNFWLWHYIKAFVHKFFDMVFLINLKASDRMMAGFQHLRQRSGRRVKSAPFWFANPRARAPKEQIFFYYLALVHRAEERGVSREPALSPLEYAERLKGYLRAIAPLSESPIEISEHEITAEQTSAELLDGEIDQITESFMEARYSQHTITASQAESVRNLWQRILKSIRNPS